jgi:ankyrin repeat protein
LTKSDEQSPAKETTKLTNELFEAVQSNNLEKLKELIAQGVNLDVRDSAGDTLLRRATKTDRLSSLSLVETLISGGADVNVRTSSTGGTALHSVAYRGYKEVVELLIASGADVNVRYKQGASQGETPLDVAQERGHTEIVEILTKAAEEQTTVEKKSSSTQGPAKESQKNEQSFEMAIPSNNVEKVKELISGGADVNVRDSRGNTPLLRAIGTRRLSRTARLSMVKILISAGADVNAKNPRGQTPLDLAKRGGQTEIVELLTKAAGERMVIHDIVITKVSAAQNCVRGETVSIVVTLDNRGEGSESCGVKLMDATNDREIARQSATIHSKHWTDSDAALTFEGAPGSNNYFGSYIAVGGDVNGDGYKDFLMSSSNYPNGAMKGRAYLYYGGTNMTGDPDKTFTGENNGDMFGDGIHQMADLNNDGFDDLLIGAVKYNAVGRLYIFYGGTDMDKIADIILESPDDKDCLFGFRPAVGDINNDGILDLVVCSPWHDRKRGCVYVYYGPITLDTNVDKIFTGENPDDAFGMYAIPDGDIDNDGCNDLLIVTRYYDGSKGRGYLYWGAEGTSMDEECDLILSVNGEQKWQFGCGVDVCDIDKDGFADIIIGSQGYKSAERGVWLYWGAPRGRFDNSVDMIFTGERNRDSFGNYISVGYANNDQYPDIMINAFYYGGGLGRSYLYYGGSKESMANVVDHTFDTSEEMHPFQTHIVDVNNDGHGDLVRGGYKYNNCQGRGYLWYGPFNTTTDITFNWDTTHASIGIHTLNVEIPPVPGEQNTEDNTKTVTIEVKEPRR